MRKKIFLEGSHKVVKCEVHQLVVCRLHQKMMPTEIDSAQAWESSQFLENEINNNILIQHCEAHNWPSALARLEFHLDEAREEREDDNRTALHIACADQADALTVASICLAYPNAMLMTDFIEMTPLHCSCSASEPSVEVVNVLLCLSQKYSVDNKLLLMQDLDGDTPLHAACRVGASLDVIRLLVEAIPYATHVRDKDGLSPLQRLWTRFVAFEGEDAIHKVLSGAAPASELVKNTWEIVELLLMALASFALERRAEFNFLQAIAENDCPHEMIKFALALYPEQAFWRNQFGQNVLDAVISSPLSTYSTQLDSEDQDQFEASDVLTGDKDEPRSLVEILLEHDSSGALYKASKEADKDLWSSPLHKALYYGKSWTEGVNALVNVDPKSTCEPDKLTSLYPFMMAACYCNGNSLSQVASIYELLLKSPEQATPEWHASRPPVAGQISGLKRNGSSLELYQDVKRQRP